MGYKISIDDFDKIIEQLSKAYLVYAPTLFQGEGAFSDTDVIRYGKVSKTSDIIFNEKAQFSFKEVLLPLSQTLFFFTEDKISEPNPEQKGAIIFLKSCDMHAVQRLDEIYLRNGSEDYYYKRIREKVKFVLMGCNQSFENCFCVDMNTNKADNYDAYVNIEEKDIFIDSRWEAIDELVLHSTFQMSEVVPTYVTENNTKVNIPDNLSLSVMDASMWEEYDARCIACGRCNFVCPTCTCFTMQDIFYQDNGKVGERRRVWASCQVNGFTDMAGGHTFREKNGQRMRYKVLHKVYDYKKRFGYHMCIGCGRCDDICPEYISFSGCINKLDKAISEVEKK